MDYHYHTHHKVLLGDLHTPVSTYLKVRDLFPQSALMESSDYHGTENNRSFIGLNPIASISVSHGIATLLYPDHSREEIEITDTCSVEQVMNRFLSRFHVTGEYAGYCGLYGYTTFNAVRYFEPIEVKDSTEAKNDAPDILRTMRPISFTSCISTSSFSTISRAKWYWWKWLAEKSRATLPR